MKTRLSEADEAKEEATSNVQKVRTDLDQTELDQAMSTINPLEKQKYDLVTQLSEHASDVLKLKSKNKWLKQEQSKNDKIVLQLADLQSTVTKRNAEIEVTRKALMNMKTRLSEADKAKEEATSNLQKVRTDLEKIIVCFNENEKTSRERTWSDME